MDYIHVQHPILVGVGGKTPLVLHAPGMKISSCCVGPLACFEYPYILMTGMLSEKLIVLLIPLKKMNGRFSVWYSVKAVAKLLFWHSNERNSSLTFSLPGPKL